jgi:hypothetical protein
MFWVHKIILFPFKIFLCCLTLCGLGRPHLPHPPAPVTSYAILLRWQMRCTSYHQPPLYSHWSFRLCSFVLVRKFIYLTTGAITIVVGRHGNWNRLLSAAGLEGGEGGSVCFSYLPRGGLKDLQHAAFILRTRVLWDTICNEAGACR